MSEDLPGRREAHTVRSGGGARPGGGSGRGRIPEDRDQPRAQTGSPKASHMIIDPAEALC